MRLSPTPPQRYIAPVIAEDVPAYRITDPAGFFSPDDELVIEGQMIYWDEEPNQAMQPLNKLAQEKYTAYLKKLDVLGRNAAEKLGKAYNGLADAYENAILLQNQESKRVKVIGAPENVPIMGGAKKRGRPRVKRVNTDDNQQPLVATGRDAIDAIRGATGG